MAEGLTSRRIAAALAIFAAAVAAADFVMIAFFSQQYNYGGESIGLYALLRLAHGLPYLGSLGDLPAIANPYGPYPLYVLWFPLRVLGLTDPYSVNVLAKIFVLTLLLLNGAAGSRILARITADPASGPKAAWAIAFLYPVLFDPMLVFSFRPDLLAVLFEILAFLVIVSRRGLLLGGLLFALAATTKANHVGVLLGVLFGAGFARGWRSAITLGASFAVSLGALVAVLTAVQGGDYWTHVVHAANFGTLSAREIPGALIRVADEVFFRHMPFHAAVLAGVLLMPRARPFRLLFAGGLAGSLLAAAAGQLKVGAYHNYFLSYFFLGAVPAALAITRLLRLLRPGATGSVRAVGWLGAAGLVAHIGAGAIPAAAVLANDMRNYPYSELKEYVARNHPTGAIYAADESLAVHFHDRVVFAPWAERCYVNSGFLRAGYLDQIKRNLASVRFEAAVVSGRNCESWRPEGEFRESISGLDRLAARFGKLCVFSR